MTKQERLDLANRLIQEIAKRGRRFFKNHRSDFVAYFYLDSRKRVWFVDCDSQKKIYTHYALGWQQFTQGGNLERLTKRIARYIQTGEQNLDIRWLGYTPKEWHGWGYPDDDLPPIWEAARPMFGPEAIAQLDAYLETIGKRGNTP